MSSESTQQPDFPAYRYTAELAGDIERHWQDYWEKNGTFEAPNPTGLLADPSKADIAQRPKQFVLDMFPYPSGAGLHVGHPLGYIGTDVFARYKRMSGFNVLHSLGYDAFGLPAEQYAVQTGQHPRVTTEANIANMRRQLRELGLGHDQRRSIATTDTEYYKWTQWIFLQLFDSWFDIEQDKARPIAELIAEFEAGARLTPSGEPYSALNEADRRKLVDSYRLAYVSDAPVNWCPGLGTVLANEEVTADGRSERGNYPVFKRNLRQWMMRITTYADRLLDDLELLDWPEPIKMMQRNWIGKSTGARVDFVANGETISVFTTRPDTLFGATYLVLAPEHPLVDKLIGPHWPSHGNTHWTKGFHNPIDAVEAYRAQAAARTDEERTAENREKTGVFIGAYATNPASGTHIPIFIADYVLMGYGTGAIMAVPAQDQRDWDFAKVFDLPVVRTVQPPDAFDGEAFTGDGSAINSEFLDGLEVAQAKQKMIDWLTAHNHGKATTTYKLRDWLFSRQRYWGEPFPILHDEYGPVAVPESMLPVELPEVDDYSPRTFDPDDAHSNPEPPLGRVQEWANVTLDLGDGPKQYRRELNVMPQWAGSCWYELRYLDPTNSQAFVDAEVERYWMGPQAPGHPGGGELYVGGVEHAVLHLLYARFWHKVLFDLGRVSSKEPYYRLFNQGYIQAYAYTDDRGTYVNAGEVIQEDDGTFSYQGQPVTQEYGKMGKSLKNIVTPDDMRDQYGADTFRVYEMSTGPLDASRPWETRAVVGSQRFLQRVWRLFVDEHSGQSRIVDGPVDDETLRVLHRTIAGVREDFELLRFNTAVAKLIELTNHITQYHSQGTPRELARPLVLMLAPLAPHIAEELWRRLGNEDSLTYVDFPVADPTLLIAETIEYPIQINGKVRSKITVPADADEATVQAAALADEKIAALLEGAAPRKIIVVPGRIVTLVK
ncbi:MAG: leucine--tRNA ligase [Corynebacteriales bacterium]|nr:leucine--tRNA ligase [Mycobacteriales bacterium]